MSSLITPSPSDPPLQVVDALHFICLYFFISARFESSFALTQIPLGGQCILFIKNQNWHLSRGEAVFRSWDLPLHGSAGLDSRTFRFLSGKSGMHKDQRCLHFSEKIKFLDLLTHTAANYMSSFKRKSHDGLCNILISNHKLVLMVSNSLRFWRWRRVCAVILSLYKKTSFQDWYWKRRSPLIDGSHDL